MSGHEQHDDCNNCTVKYKACKSVRIKQCFSGISAAIEALIVLLFAVHLLFQPDQILVCRMILSRAEIFMKIKVFLIVRIRLKKDISL